MPDDTSKYEEAALDYYARKLGKSKQMADEAKIARDEVSEPMRHELKSHDLTSHRVSMDNGQHVVVSLKQRDNSKYNAERLKKMIGARMFNKLTTPQLDESKIEAAIQLGDLDPNLVAQCIDEQKTEYLDVRLRKMKR